MGWDTFSYISKFHYFCNITRFNVSMELCFEEYQERIFQAYPKIINKVLTDIYTKLMYKRHLGELHAVKDVLQKYRNNFVLGTKPTPNHRCETKPSRLWRMTLAKLRSRYRSPLQVFSKPYWARITQSMEKASAAFLELERKTTDVNTITTERLFW